MDKHGAAAPRRALRLDAPDSVIGLRAVLEPLHGDAEETAKKGRGKKAKSAKSNAEGGAGETGRVRPSAIDGLAERPEGRFDLFQDHLPLTFGGGLGRPDNWQPPALGGGQVQSWTGEPDRVELVETLKLVVNVNGKGLVEAELDYAVRMFEAQEMSAQRENWESALRIALDLLRRFPNWSLVYFKAGLALVTHLALLRQVRHIEVRREQARLAAENKPPPLDGDYAPRFATQTEPDVIGAELESHSSAVSDARSSGGDRAAYAETGVQSACPFFRCAMELEPRNRQLAGLVDLVLRFCTHVAVPRASKLRDPALYPRSLGDAVALAFLERGQAAVEGIVS